MHTSLQYHNNPEVKLFSGRATRYLADKMAEHYGKKIGDLKTQTFSDGEFQPVINESVRGAYVFMIQSTFPPSDNLMELLMMIDAAKRASASYITAVIPYFGIARQDRKDRPRVSLGSKLTANLITAAGANRVMTMDLHAGQIQGFFDIPVDHLNSSAIFIPYIQSLGLENLAFASPDVGSTKRARAYAQHFNADLVLCDKHRMSPNEVSTMTVIGDVKDKNIVIVDDIFDTSNTLCNAVDILMEKGAKSVRAIGTHPVLSGNAYENINNSQLTELVVCDTIPLKKESPKIKVLSVDSIFATAIRHLHEHKSINSLFIDSEF
ncbi:MAG: ribose-phosphate pyrophosphokinase [Bacteroidetes bacterium SW_11_45_7]|nr:MAG: ribose-phosphate pyrophosphokinase [Bacteroidetes bacterium SW_11_45_7]